MTVIKIKGRSITRGIAEGEAMVSTQAFSFSHGLDPYTGHISDDAHEWLGQDARGKVLVFTYGKGSTSGGLYILEAAKHGNLPAAVVCLETDPVAAGGFVMAELLYNARIPVIDRPDKNPTELIKPGDRVRVDADKGTIEISR